MSAPAGRADHAGAVLRVEGLVTRLGTGAGAFTVVEDVSLTVGRGEAVALVGESGSGKTMTALSLMRLLPERAAVVAGEAWLGDLELLGLSEGSMEEVRGRRAGMVFQDPLTYLNPLMRVGDQVGEALRAHGLAGRAGARAAAVRALARAGLPAPDRVYAAYPHQLSGGMRQRAMIAMAVACEPELLIADEPTTALDVTTQTQIMVLLSGLRHDLGGGLLLITHDLGLVAQYCDRVYVMYGARIVESNSTVELFRSPGHPYTSALLAATLGVESAGSLRPIPGQPPSLQTPPAGCRFHPRCPVAFDRCREAEPPLTAGPGGSRVRCWLHHETGR